MNDSRPQTIGVLSDTHCSGVDDQFRKQATAAFSTCDAIVHAGDLTSLDILDVFGDKKRFAVHGNMCSLATKSALPESMTFTLDRFRFGLCHGDGLGYDTETRLFALFPGADCIVFGHTHRPLVQRFGPVLLVNPGSFRGTGRYGRGGTYSIVTVDKGGLSAAIHSMQPES